MSKIDTHLKTQIILINIKNLIIKEEYISEILLERVDIRENSIKISESFNWLKWIQQLLKLLLMLII